MTYQRHDGSMNMYEAIIHRYISNRADEYCMHPNDECHDCMYECPPHSAKEKMFYNIGMFE